MTSALAIQPVRNDLRPAPDEIALMCENARMVRLETIRLIQLPKVGHFSSVFSCAEIFSSLYCGVMSVKKGDPDWEDCDRFTFGKGHAAVGLCLILTDMGSLPKEVLDGYCSLGNPLGDHPDMIRVPVCVIANTVKGRGIDLMENETGWHLGYLTPEDSERATQKIMSKEI